MDMKQGISEEKRINKLQTPLKPEINLSNLQGCICYLQSGVSYMVKVDDEECQIPASILRKSTSGRHRPVSYPDGPITARYRFT